MAYIEIRNLTKSYGNRIVLDDISLQMDKGEIMAVVGPSGTGKSTFLRIMCGIVKEDVGEVYVDGTNILERPLDKRNILMMFQNFELFPHLNVWDNIAFGLKAKKIAKEEIEKKVTYFLELISLENRKDAYPNELLGGEKRRVALARALINKPNILLLDEPFSSLDEILRDRIRRTTFDILKKLKISTIFVTHSMEEAAMYSDRIIITQEGKILGIGKAKDLYQSPANKKVAEILYKDNVFDDYFLTKEDIEIYPGSKYHIDRKNFVNGEFRYEVGQYVVYSTSEYDLGDRVDIDIKWRRYYEKSSG